MLPWTPLHSAGTARRAKPDTRQSTESSVKCLAAILRSLTMRRQNSLLTAFVTSSFMAMRSGSSNESLQRSSLPRCPGSALELLDLSSRLQAPRDPSASRRTRGRRFPRLSGCSSTTSRNHAELTPNKRGPSSSSRGSSVSTVSARPANSLQATAALLKQSNL